MAVTLDSLQSAIAAALGPRLKAQKVDRGELTVEVAAADQVGVLQTLRDDAGLAFTILLDVIGVDYQGYAGPEGEGPRYAVVFNLLSITHNTRVRVRVFCTDDDFPAVDTVTPLWPSANWYEREAPACIISTAQQASPKVMGHSDPVRAQLSTLSTPVTTKPCWEMPSFITPIREPLSSTRR